MRHFIIALLFIVPLAFALTPINPGDLNADYTVNIIDVNLVTGCLGQSAATCQSGRADPNNDNAVNIFDFVYVAQQWGRTYSAGDTTPPVATITSPTMNQIIPAGTTQWTLTVTTDEPATCKHHGSDTTYSSMSNTFTGIGTTTHTDTITLQDGTTKTRYVRCQDTATTPNVMQSSESVTYSVATGQTCGNGVQEGTESCDLGVNNGACPSTCSNTCTTNTCSNNCGNGAIDAGEQCDGTNLNGATCITRGFTGGTLSCSASTCQYVTSACTNPPPPSGTLCANEPPGLTQISNRAFNTKVESGWTDRGDNAFSIVSDSTTSSGQPGPQSPPNVGQARFAGALGGSGPIMTNLDIPSKPRELYFCFQNQFSSNFYGGDIAGINKMFHIWQHGATVVVLSAQGRGMGALSPQMRLQNVQVGPNIPSFNINPTLNGTSFVRGQWQQVEVLLIGNTPGQQDGEIHWWVDGSKKGQKTDIGWVSSGGNPGWEKVSWNPTYGSTGDVVPAPQYQWIDNWYVSGQ